MRKKHHIPGIEERLQKYSDARKLDFNQYSPYHMRIMDGGYTVVDIWTTGRYYILTTDYVDMIGEGIRERGSEKGFVPYDTLETWLDELFFPQLLND